MKYNLDFFSIYSKTRDLFEFILNKELTIVYFYELYHVKNETIYMYDNLQKKEINYRENPFLNNNISVLIKVKIMH